MNSCQEVQVLLSALVDQELHGGEVFMALDHAMACGACRRFYRRARSLDVSLKPAAVPAAARIREAGDDLPEGVWENIERRSIRDAFTWRPGPVWKMAAMVLVAFGLWSVGQVRTAPSAPLPAQVELVLEESRGAMSDARFMEITTELLRADRRFHRAMFEVMRDVNEVSGSGEGSNVVVESQSEWDGGADREEGEPRLPS